MHNFCNIESAHGWVLKERAGIADNSEEQALLKLSSK